MLRVLCLHGAHQTSEIFANQLSKLTSSLHDIAEFDFLDAPHELPLLNLEDDVHTRSWSRHKSKTNNSTSSTRISSSSSSNIKKESEMEVYEEDYSESDALLDQKMTYTQYDVLLGFSQGALMICRYVMRHSQQFASSSASNTIKGIIIAGAPDPRQCFAQTELLAEHVRLMEHWYTCNVNKVKNDKSVTCFTNDNTTRIRRKKEFNINEISESSRQVIKSTTTSFFANLPSLHIIGQQDIIVPPEESRLFAEACQPNATCVLHDHAHSFPQLKVIIDAVRLFCEKLQPESATHLITETDVDDELLVAKSTELEMIASMYGEECIEYDNTDNHHDDANTTRDNDKLRKPIVVSLPLLPELAYEHDNEDDKYTNKNETDATTTLSISNNNSNNISVEHILSHLLLCFTLLPTYPASLPILDIHGGPSWHSVEFEKWKRALLDTCKEFMKESLNDGGDGMLILSTLLCATTEANNTMAELQQSVVHHSANNLANTNANNNSSSHTASISNYNINNNNNNNNNNINNTNVLMATSVTALCEDAKWLDEDAAARSAFITQSEAEVVQILAKHRKAVCANSKTKNILHEESEITNVLQHHQEEQEEQENEDEEREYEDVWNNQNNTNSDNNSMYESNSDVALGAGSTGSGSWKLTIGLIGKPSAGKSTFFNAVTDPQSESDAAKVAAFPFTTIEPNIGSGYGPVFCPCSVLHQEHKPTECNTTNKSTGVYLECASCDANYGHVHDSVQRTFRRHPIIIKDVAGLVQGAYEGKGKGNQFLNDLCDADVLIHVVDGAAATDCSGTSCTPGQGSTLEDITWVRAEVHNWVYDNLRRKWSSIVRMPVKFKTMFTGYQCSVKFVQHVLSLLNIHDDDELTAAIRKWGPAELHLFVACFVHLRFPMIMALNKSDLPTAHMLHSELLRKYPHEMFVPMSAQVECDLLILRKHLFLDYLSGEHTFTLHPHNLVSLHKDDRQRLDRVHSFFSTSDNITNEVNANNQSKEVLEQSSTSNTKVSLRTTGVQDVLMAALSQCAALFVFPVKALRPCISSLKHCFTFRRGTQAETVFWSMTYAHLIDGKLVRFEYVNARKPDEDVVVIKKTDVIPQSAVLVRVLTNKRQMS